jgi:hypothetical protein
MFYDNPSDTHESGPRFRLVLAELWHDWLEAISEVSYQTHRAAEFLAESSDPSNPRHNPFASHWTGQTEGASGSIDMKKLEECLQSMEPMQAAQVLHAVRMMQAMEAVVQRRSSRANEERAAW